MTRTLAALGLGIVLHLCGCTVWIEFYTVGEGGSGGAGGSGDTTSSAGAAGSGGAGGAPLVCVPGEVIECYSGPPETQSKGECHAGTQTCSQDGQTFGECIGEKLPQPEECASAKDEDCDGLAPACKGLCVWSSAFGDSLFQVGTAIASGASGVALTGFFGGTVDFGGGPTTSAGGTDIFVAKLAPDGSHLWSKAFGDADIQVPTALAFDATGNVIVTGRFSGTVSFGGGPTSSAGGTDIFVAKLAANDGSILWSRAFGDDKDQTATGAAVDGAGNVVLAGLFAGTVDFGDGPKTSAGVTDIFVAKLAANDGAPLWARTFGDAVSQGTQDIVIAAAVDPAGNVLLAGPLAGAVDFGAGPKSSAGSTDIFVAKLAENDGAPVWAGAFGDAEAQSASGLAVDGAGDVLVVGSFKGTVDFGAGPHTNAGGTDIFVAKLAAGDGAALWSKAFGDGGDQAAKGIAIDGAGNVAASGACSGSVDFGGGPLPCLGNADIFIAKLDPTGQHVWAKRFGDANDQAANGVAFDPVGNLLMTGFLSSTVDFGCGPLVPAGGADVFVAKLSP